MDSAFIRPGILTMKPFLFFLALLVAGCATTKLTEIEPRTAETTPSPTSTQFHARDSVVIRWVVMVRDSVSVRDSTVIHVATAEQKQFYIYSWWTKDSRGDSSYSTFDSQTENGNTDLYFGPVEVSYQDTTHTVTNTPPAEFGLLDRIGLGAICFLAGVIATLAAKNNLI